jgi:hypothetical protein
MNFRSICFVILITLPIFSSAKDVKVEAENEFNGCLKETKKERDQCTFGGCGNIVGACYDRQINMISQSTEALEKKINAGRCAQAAISASRDIGNLDSKLKSLAPFDNTWGGYEVQVEMALLKNSVMSSLAGECEIKK